jgi:hypothetical protein
MALDVLTHPEPGGEDERQRHLPARVVRDLEGALGVAHIQPGSGREQVVSGLTLEIGDDCRVYRNALQAPFVDHRLQ